MSLAASAMVAAPQPEAAEAGADVLRAGGNAVDAAVAAALVQTVVDPIMCGLAGFGALHVRLADGRQRVLDFHGRAPKAVRPEMWAHLIRGESEDGFGFLLEGAVNEIGYQSITTPMTLKALAEATERYGSRPFAELLAPAIAHAREGFVVRPHVRAFWDEIPSGGRVPHSEFVTRYPATAAIYTKADGTLARVGERVHNPDMARTLERIARDGPEDFYTGAIAAEIVADMEAHGGLLSGEDLAEVAPSEDAPLQGNYRGHRIATNAPPGGGLMLLEMLNILECFDLAAMGHNSPQYIATVSEAMKIATIDKDTHIGDPRFVEVPVGRLASKDYAAERAARIKAGEKAHVVRLNQGGEESKDTTHLSVADAAGNAVALTHSIGMPSGVVSAGLGFMYNGCMGVFDPRPGRAGSLAPGKSRFTAMCPTMLFAEGEDAPWLVIGAPGGTFITMGVLQGVLNAVDFGMSALEAVSAPRFCTTSDTIDLTNRILRGTETELQAMGYPTRRSALSYGFAGVHALRRTAAGWDGGADPGRDGMAVGV
ncbi:MAG: gamma-glutamyltransferase family protein [Pseudomonadota bacterium]